MFEVFFLFEFFGLSTKSVILTKLTISFRLATFACTNFAAKCFTVSLLNSGIVIYLLWSSILFSTAVGAVVEAKLVILGILFSISFI